MTPKLRKFLHELKDYGIRHNIPNISFETAEILQFFLRISNARDIWEIGCANGFSTVFLADYAHDVGGRVVTCDVSEPSFLMAQDNIKKSGLEEVVDFRFGDALKVLQATEKFDAIFIDGQKSRTHEFFATATTHLHPQGIILIDDTALFPEKMAEFQKLRARSKEYRFFDIPVDTNDTLTVCFRMES